ncbi:MAG: cephalosporin hydroxylase [Okeania sp. SIO2H7]|nr:cephalosporin hydroxylase [Okeania sp. SIO2H7]
MDSFEEKNREQIQKMGVDAEFKDLSHKWYLKSAEYEYEYHFTWLGRPFLQLPQDMIAMQEIIYRVKPALIIETGIARGGSLIFYGSMLELIGEEGIVVGIDVDIREHNRVEIEKHRMFKRIEMIQGSSLDEAIVGQVAKLVEGKKSVLVCLDSNHTHDHVLKELELYSPFVTKGSYLVVCDTIIEDMPDEYFPNRPWKKGNNPKTAVWEFLKTSDRFEIDKELEDKLLITQAPDGYLKCVKD